MIHNAARDVWPKRARLAELRRDIRQAETFARPGLPLGLAAIDAHLPRGLVRGALHEVGPRDYRATPAAFGFLAALAIRLVSAGEGPVLWPCLVHEERHFGTLYGPGLRRIGLDPGRLILVRCTSARDFLWALEEGVRQGGLGAVIGARPAKMSLTQSRRLQLAATESETPVLLLRRAEDDGPSAAVTRWRIAPLPGGRDRFDFLASFRWQATLEHARGGRPGTWAVEWDHDAHRFHSSSVLADREDAQVAQHAHADASKHPSERAFA